MLQLGLTSPSADVSAELLRELYVRLFEADERGDAVTLARVGWRLFAIITEVQEAEREAAAVLNTLRCAACAVCWAGAGSRRPSVTPTTAPIAKITLVIVLVLFSSSSFATSRVCVPLRVGEIPGSQALRLSARR